MVFQMHSSRLLSTIYKSRGGKHSFWVLNPNHQVALQQNNAMIVVMEMFKPINVQNQVGWCGGPLYLKVLHNL